MCAVCSSVPFEAVSRFHHEIREDSLNLPEHQESFDESHDQSMIGGKPATDHCPYPAEACLDLNILGRSKTCFDGEGHSKSLVKSKKPLQRSIGTETLPRVQEPIDFAAEAAKTAARR